MRRAKESQVCNAPVNMTFRGGWEDPEDSIFISHTFILGDFICILVSLHMDYAFIYQT